MRIRNKLITIRFLLVTGCILAFLHGRVSDAQNAPVTTIATVGNVLPGQVQIPVTVAGFNNIGAISLSIDYTFAGLQYAQGTPNPALPGFGTGFQNLGNGKHRITMGWFGTGTSLPDGTAIITLTFTYISGITALEFFDNGPSCEYADGGYNVLNDIPTGSYYVNGTVCGAPSNPGVIAGEAAVCPGQSAVGYSVAPVLNATGYIWTVPPGAVIASGQNTSAVSVNYSPASTSGTITVKGTNVCGNGPSSQLPVTVNELPVANAGNDQSIPYGTSTTLYAASGGPGSYTYNWLPETLLVNPNIQNPQTVSLTVSTLFTLVVTNQATLCTNSDDMTVSITGGPLTAAPIAVPADICRGETAQLFSNAGGGSGNYTYTWTCSPPGSPPWSSTQQNPIVSPDSSRAYNLLLSDGFNSVQAATSLTVFQLPAATISGGDTLCGEGLSTTLTVELSGVPPWDFYYSNGMTTWHVEGQYTTPYQVYATEAGDYTILAVSDANCNGTASGSAPVAVFPVPPSPVISVFGSELHSTGCCGNQWYRDGMLIPGATGQTYTPQHTAHYADIVTVDGCSSDTSNTLYFLMTGVRPEDKSTCFLEPNPADHYVTIRSDNGFQHVDEILICSITGKPVLIYPVGKPVAGNDLPIDIEALSPGMYFVAVCGKSGRITMKLLVR